MLGVEGKLPSWTGQTHPPLKIWGKSVRLSEENGNQIVDTWGVGALGRWDSPSFQPKNITTPRASHLWAKTKMLEPHQAQIEGAQPQDLKPLKTKIKNQQNHPKPKCKHGMGVFTKTGDPTGVRVLFAFLVTPLQSLQKGHPQGKPINQSCGAALFKFSVLHI